MYKYCFALTNPPDSVVWSADEQCQLQALTRTQSSLPCAPGHCATQTHTYKRHGITTLFAAMNMGSGEVVYTFHPQHRHQEWIQFLGMIEERTAPDQQAAGEGQAWSAASGPVRDTARQISRL